MAVYQLTRSGVTHKVTPIKTLVAVIFKVRDDTNLRSTGQRERYLSFAPIVERTAGMLLHRFLFPTLIGP